VAARLLGDRLRMHASGADREVFIRSLACRGEFGGLSAEVWPMSLAMLAAFDIVLVETVGVGQKEIDVSKMTDTTCFVAQPASGDSIQFLKAGIMEIPHVIVVNKEDIGMAARKTLSELKTTLGRRTDSDGWQAPALSASAALGSGIEALADALDGHRRTGCWSGDNSPPAASAVRRNGWSSTCVRNLVAMASNCWVAKMPFCGIDPAPRRSPIAAYEDLRASA
jgi:LAO/AO transport system kinase